MQYDITSYNIISSYVRLLHNVLVFPCFFPAFCLLELLSSFLFDVLSNALILPYLTSPYLTLPYQLILINPVVSFTFFKLTNICSVGDLNHTSTDTGMRMGSGYGIGSGSPLIQGQGRGHGVDDKNALLASTFLLSPFPLGSRSK